MFYAKRLLSFGIFAFFMAVLSACTTIYNAKLPSNIKTVEGAKKDLAVLLEKPIRIYYISSSLNPNYAKQIFDNMVKNNQISYGEWSPSNGNPLDYMLIDVYHIKVLSDGLDIPFTPLFYEDFKNSNIEVTYGAGDADFPDLNLPNEMQLFEMNNDVERLQKIADDLYFIGQNIDKYNEEQFSVFKEKAARYRSLKIKPSMSEEQRKFLVQADQSNQMKNYFGAIELYLKAIEIDPCSYPRAYSNLALLYAQVHRYNMAISYMKRYLLLGPGAKDARSAQDKIYGWELMAGKN